VTKPTTFCLNMDNFEHKIAIIHDKKTYTPWKTPTCLPTVTQYHLSSLAGGPTFNMAAMTTPAGGMGGEVTVAALGSC
jgi:hypothetical protein